MKLNNMKILIKKIYINKEKYIFITFNFLLPIKFKNNNLNSLNS